MNVDRLNRYCVKLVKRLNVVSRKGKILSKIYKIYIWNNKYCYRHWKIINVLKIWYIVVYKNLFYFSFLLVYKSNTLCLRFTNYKSRYTQEKNCFRLKILKAISFFFFTIQDFFASISNDRSNNRRFIRKRSKRNFSLLLFVIPSVSPPFFSISFFPYSLYTRLSLPFLFRIFSL